MKKAMIVAAGLGTRLKPLTDNMPKALVPVGERPLLSIVIEKLAQAGYDDIVVNVHHFGDMIETWLRDAGFLSASGAAVSSAAASGAAVSSAARVRVRISDERDLLRDTGGGIRHAGPLLCAAPVASASSASSASSAERSSEALPKGRFLVHNVDILSDMDLTLFDRNFPEDALAVLAVSERKTSRYLLFDDDMRLRGWTNVATGEVRSPYPDFDPASCSRYAFSGIQMISDRIFKVFDDEGFGEKFSIIDFYLRIADRYPIYGLVPDNLRLIDVGKPEALAQAQDFFTF